MDTRFWGPYGWNLLHTIPECLPEEFDIGVARKVDAFYRECFGALPCV